MYIIILSSLDSVQVDPVNFQARSSDSDEHVIEFSVILSIYNKAICNFLLRSFFCFPELRKYVAETALHSSYLISFFHCLITGIHKWMIIAAFPEMERRIPEESKSVHLQGRLLEENPYDGFGNIRMYVEIAFSIAFWVMRTHKRHINVTRKIKKFEKHWWLDPKNHEFLDPRQRWYVNTFVDQKMWASNPRQDSWILGVLLSRNSSLQKRRTESNCAYHAAGHNN